MRVSGQKPWPAFADPPSGPPLTTPHARYQELLATDAFAADPSQAAAVARLDDLYRRLEDRGRRPRGLTGWLARLHGGRAPERGLYLCGGVGRGKTLLMDLFYECLPFDDKLRMHFHRFMHRTHRELTRLSGAANPLETVAEGLARETRVLCFDELFVSDIGDAMILGELLHGLFRRGVSLVATSNLPPERLYENGLQRRRFLPAIEALERHTEVLCVDGGVDYRLRVLTTAEIFHAPLDASADASLAASFAALAVEAPAEDVQLAVEGRFIRARRVADDVVWFDFAAICDGPRSQNDYIELARIYHAVLISGVPCFDAGREDQARRFIALVDELYDRNVKLILSAAVPIAALYQGTQLGFEFERTASRLEEMQSHDYLARSHRP